MPEISRFEGIIITMYFNDHNPPHFHVEYNNMEAIYDLSEDAFIKGAVPLKQARLVLEWVKLHKEELTQMWEDKKFKKVEPLT